MRMAKIHESGQTGQPAQCSGVRRSALGLCASQAVWWSLLDRRVLRTGSAQSEDAGCAPVASCESHWRLTSQVVIEDGAGASAVATRRSDSGGIAWAKAFRAEGCVCVERDRPDRKEAGRKRSVKSRLLRRVLRARRDRIQSLWLCGFERHGAVRVRSGARHGP